MITHVAIKYKGKVYSLPKPNRHHNVIKAIAADQGDLDGNEKQGFLDDKGNFLTRRQALQHAIDSGRRITKTALKTGVLYSEDLW